jgi:beta-glucosidase
LRNDHLWDRRHLLLAGAGIGISTKVSAAPMASEGTILPHKFLWGAATAGHQVEGNNTNADLWVLEHVQPTVFKEPSGDACDSLHRWQEDLDIIRDLGLNTYRFSLEWSRIEPAPGEFSRAMLEYYLRIIDGAHERGISPMVTFNHFTTPIWFAARGGWEVPGASDLFARYCERASRHLGKNIPFATTLNEPNLLRLLKWLPLAFPPAFKETEQAMLAAAAKATGSARFTVANFGMADPKVEQMIDAHKKGYAAIKTAWPDIQVGVSLSMTDDQAVGPNSQRDAKRNDCYRDWLDAAKTGDFVGVQNYGRQRLNDKGAMPPPAGAELTDSGEEFYPDSLNGAVTYAHAATGKPVVVTENGIDTVDDARRTRYIPLAIAGMLRAMAAGVPVLGYVHWSLLDNFEWLFGYGPKYGLVKVDRETFKRTVKNSARVYADIVKTDPKPIHR